MATEIQPQREDGLTVEEFDHIKAQYPTAEGHETDSGLLWAAIDGLGMIAKEAWNYILFEDETGEPLMAHHSFPVVVGAVGVVRA